MKKFLFTLLLALIAFTETSFQLDYSNKKSKVPECSKNPNYNANIRPRIAVISHDSAINTFTQNPEQGARDAATILDVQLEWNSHFINSASKMKSDIYDAVNDKVDGIIVTIPNQEVLEAVKYAISKNIPVLVYSAGLEYAEQLGLTRILLRNRDSGYEIARELLRRGYTNPLVIQISTIDDVTFGSRLLGIGDVFGKQPDLLVISDENDTIQSINTLTDHLIKNTQYDSVISLGGSQGTSIVSTAALSVLRNNTNRKLGVAFFDTSDMSMPTLIAEHKDVFGISQLPYFQAALPVFIMYLRIITGFDVFKNQTIDTGPIWVTNDTWPLVKQNEQTTLIPLKEKDAKVGAIVPNSEGDSYNGAILAGFRELATRLNWHVWNVVESGPLGVSLQLKREIDHYVEKQVAGFLIQTSNPDVLSYALTKVNNTDIPMVTLGNFYEPLDFIITR
ncbi:hypothetical protein BDF20DRAFT_205332 [Mycotypha africana]|uniref:uncharacterized protein n=1 Tax=Mycotypha africana TaxID=64632 RepID=UPI00230019DC|nr:uncharacterized protein BDF20DRAFT_205332 [Mycotypha africana]KAI8968049.1 hypothetical protein BDF20DRAFT_205332 [Mycotypha africana]